MGENEEIYKKSLVKSITARYGMNMNEVVVTLTGKKIGATFLEDQK